MDSVLKKIVEIEKEAQKITDEAVLATENLSQEIEEEKRQFEIKSEQLTSERISQILKIEQEDEEKIITEQNAEHKKQLETFRTEFLKNSSVWEKQLFESIIRK